MIEKQHTMFAFGHNTSLFYLRSRDSDPILIPHLKIYSTLFAVQAPHALERAPSELYTIIFSVAKLKY